ncbi:MAG: hypothetical protein NTZ85_02980 [Bacteroidia bacterium]|nr:hypothetical protein [Bacteroidia bacterium]
MKSKFLVILLLFVIPGLLNSSFAQNKQKAANIEKIVWFGVDFTAVKFTLVTDDPVKIVNQYLSSINTVILVEPEKYNIKQYFNKAEVVNSIETAVESNLKINPSGLVVTSEYKLDPGEIKNIIQKYNSKDNSGTGLVFIAENLSKVSLSGSYYVCFFDIATKEIIDSRRMVGAVGGFGFRNYWASTIFNIMKVWSLQ